MQTIGVALGHDQKFKISNISSGVDVGFSSFFTDTRGKVLRVGKVLTQTHRTVRLVKAMSVETSEHPYTEPNHVIGGHA